MSIQLTFRIKLLSDYHVSAGHGWGALLDSALHRDADGIPVLRGTALTGLLRNGLNELAATQAMEDKQWPLPNCPTDAKRPLRPADVLFGAPGCPKRWQISSGRPTGMGSPQRGTKATWTPNGRGGQAAAHVRVDPALRRAEARKLFVREEGDQRLEFEFMAECYEVDEQTLREAALLVASARMVRHLGAGRRRGRGWCSVRLHETQGWPVKDGENQPDQDKLLTWFDTVWLQAKPLIDFQFVQTASFSLAAPTSESLRLVLVVRTDEPILIARRAEAGNQFEGLDYIPGFALRGALAGQIASRHNLQNENSPVYQTFARLFFRDGVRMSPLYPALAGGSDHVTPTIPAPLDLFVNELHPRSKNLAGNHPVYDARQAARKDFKDCANGVDLKIDTIDKFLAVAPEAPLVKARRSSEMHVTMHEETGRAKDQELFSYVTLDAGQYYVGELFFDDKAAWQMLRELADLPDTAIPGAGQNPLGSGSAAFSLRIGKAFRRGYGKVTAVLYCSREPGSSMVEGLPLAQRVTANDQPLVMTLISDAIVLDPWSRSYQGFDDAWLSEALGLKVRIAYEVGPSNIPHALQFARARVVDSFNNHVGLPRHRDLSLVAGSSVTLDIAETIDLAELHNRLRAAEISGIGVRRGEGFGQLVFNHPVYDHACAHVGNVSIRIPPELRLGSSNSVLDSDATFQEIWDRVLREADWKKFKHQEFNGLVRQIHTARIQSREQARDLLANYGKAETVVLGGLPGRQKPNFFENEGKSGLELLSSLFDSLDAHTGNSTDKWRMGCWMLTNQLARVVLEIGDR